MLFVRKNKAERQPDEIPLERSSHGHLLSPTNNANGLRRLHGIPLPAYCVPSSDEQWIRELLIVSAKCSGQGRVHCFVRQKSGWLKASLEWDLAKSRPGSFTYTPVEQPQDGAAAYLLIDASSEDDDYLSRQALQQDMLVLCGGELAKLFFTCGYDQAELELWLYQLSEPANEDTKPLTAVGTENYQFDSLYQGFVNMAEAFPQRLALVEGDTCFTYQQLRETVECCAARMTQLLASRNPIGIVLPRDISQVVVQLACHGLGCPIVPLYFDTPAERLQAQIKQSDCQLVITNDAKQAELSGFVAAISYQMLLQSEPGDFVAAPLGLREASTHFYTSGSEGMPKGVLLPGMSIARTVKETNFIEFKTDDVLSFVANPAFDVSALELWGAFLNGCTLAIISKRELLDIEVLKQRLVQYRVTVSFFTTGLFNRLAEADPELFALLRVVEFAGEKASIEHVRRAMQHAPQTEFINCYGPTENGVTTALVITPEHLEYKDLSIGTPITGTQLCVVDSQCQQLPRGQVGQLLCFGDGLALGYVGQPGLTAAKFIPIDGKPAYLTGDYVRVAASGEIEYLGRIDNQIKLNGFRIELAEIERCLLENPQITSAFVRLDTTSRQLQAFVAPISIDVESALVSCSSLPEYMHPSAIIPIGAIPLNPNGKVDLKALDQLVLNLQAPVQPLAERHGLLAEVVDVYQQVLRAPVLRDQAELFELGGNSLHLMQLLSELRNKFSVPLTLEFLADNSSPAAVSDWIDLARWNNSDSDEMEEEWVF